MTIINKTKFLEFKSAKSPSGSDWYYVNRTNDIKGQDSAVVIVPVVKINNVNHFLFIITKRPPVIAENKAQYCIECPAGLIGDEKSDEKLLECAHKELLEETGLMAQKMYIELTNSSTSAGLSSETLSYVTAYCENNTIVQPPVSDGGIITERIYVKVNDVMNYIENLDKKEFCVASPTLCAIFLTLNRLNKIPF